jgi:metacaspase-1
VNKTHGWAVLTALAACALLSAGSAFAASKVLLIGVGKYRLPNNDLPGIDLDIENMKHVAKIMGFAAGDTLVLFDEQATHAGVKSALTGWLRDGVRPEDRVLIYFSGHGTRVPDPRPSNASGIDDALVLHDVKTAKVNGRPSLANVLFGYEFGEALAAIPSRHILVLVDACHSGTATRTIALGNRRLGEGAGAIKFFNWPGAPTGHTRALRSETLAENYAAVSAARDDEYAIATEHGGLFTLGVLDTIDAASRDAKRLSVAQLRTLAAAYIERHTDEQSRHHPVADGNKQMIEGQLDLIPLRNGNGPTWAALDSLARQGEPLVLKAGAAQLRIGDEITLAATVPRTGFLNVVAIDSQDRATVLYPNQYAPTNDVVPGTFEFPTASMGFVLRATEPVGPTLVVAFLTDRKVNLLDMGIEGRDAAGKMQATFTEVTARATRAISVEARHQGFAAGAVTITVTPGAAH